MKLTEQQTAELKNNQSINAAFDKLDATLLKACDIDKQKSQQYRHAAAGISVIKCLLFSALEGGA